MQKTKRVVLVAILFPLVMMPLMLLAFSGGPPPGRTGAPGEQTCFAAGCHMTASGELITSSDSIQVMFPNGATYEPGFPQRLIVAITDDRPIFGFQLSAREPSNDQAGILTPIDATTSVVSAAGIQYIRHTAPRPDGMFTFEWTPPQSDVGTVTLYVAANAANGNFAPTGDRIHLQSFSVEPAADGGAPPAINTGGVVLGNLLPTVNSISANAIISIFGSNFAPEGFSDINPELDDEGRVATNQNDVCVEINGERSPILHVFSGQLNLQTPTLSATGPVSVEVITSCDTASQQRSVAEMVTVEEFSPAFFVFRIPGFVDAGGENPIAALHGGGPDVVADPNMIAGARPAEPGEFISLFGTGFGQTGPPLEAGEIPMTALSDTNGQARITGDLSVTIGEVTLAAEDIFYAGVAPCCAGLYQLVVRVPESAADGNHAVDASVDGLSTPSGPFIPVQAPQ